MAALLMAIFLFIMAACNFTDDKWFLGVRAKKLVGEKRKKFRRIQAAGLFLTALWMMAIFIVDELLHMELNLAACIILYIIIGILCVCMALFIEMFCFRRIHAE